MIFSLKIPKIALNTYAQCSQNRLWKCICASLHFESRKWPENDVFMKIIQNETEDMRIHNKDEYDVAVKGSNTMSQWTWKWNVLDLGQQNVTLRYFALLYRQVNWCGTEGSLKYGVVIISFIILSIKSFKKLKFGVRFYDTKKLQLSIRTNRRCRHAYCTSQIWQLERGMAVKGSIQCLSENDLKQQNVALRCSDRDLVLSALSYF